MDFDRHYESHEAIAAQAKRQFELEQYNKWVSIIQDRIPAVLSHFGAQPPVNYAWITLQERRTVSWPIYDGYDEGLEINLLPTGRFAITRQRGRDDVPREVTLEFAHDLTVMEIPFWAMREIFNAFLGSISMPDASDFYYQFKRYSSRYWTQASIHEYFRKDPFAYVTEVPEWLQEVLADAIDNLEAHNWSFDRDESVLGHFPPGINTTVRYRNVAENTFLIRNGGLIDSQGQRVDLSDLPQHTQETIFRNIAKVANRDKREAKSYSHPETTVSRTPTRKRKSGWEKFLDWLR